MLAKRDFTDRFLKSIKPASPGKRLIIYDAQVPGFGVRVTDKGAISFVLVDRYPGSPHPTARLIDRYPAVSLAKARGVAREWKEDLRHGVDPKAKEAQRQRAEERRRATTFGAVFALFADDHLSTLRSGHAVKAAIARHVIPHWGDRPISELKRIDVRELMLALRKTVPVQTNRVLTNLKVFFNWCLEQELIESSCVAGIKRPTKEITRDRVLVDAEIRAIWHVCGALGAIGRALRFMLATGQRRTEVGSMKWSELNLAERMWILPRERAKAGRSHEVPLSSLALSILEECPRLEPFVFTTNGTRPVRAWGQAKAALDGLGIADWRLHDLRRTCASNLARCGVDRITISKILNHSEGGVTSIYDRYARDSEKRRAMNRWSERLAEIISAC
jgi:integrase